MDVSLLSEHVVMLTIMEQRASIRGQSAHIVRSFRHFQALVCRTEIPLSCNIGLRP
jgi:hypothetical protein